MIVDKIENGLERDFVEHRLTSPLITDPMCSECCGQGGSVKQGYGQVNADSGWRINFLIKKLG